MQFGIDLPISGPFASPEAIVAMAIEAERLGYAAIWTYERMLYPVGEQTIPDFAFYSSGTYEPLETLSYIAAKTERIKLGTSIITAPFHVPVILARRFATLDQLSGGRVLAGLGQGWMEHEFAAANVSLRERGKKVEEFITAMRAAWGPDPVNYQGRFYQIPLSNNNPKPLQEGGIPILLGTFAQAGIERAARMTDGLILIGFSAEQIQQTVSSLRTTAQAAGRDPSSLQIVVRVNVPITADPLPEGDRPFLGGSAEQIAKDVDQLRPLAVDHVLFSDRASPTLDDAMQRLAELQAALW
ncbi:MAG: TIGR03619 family F420-dependent LLM class oxidoreductase [Chloroflexi bacterium]|nr:TIGR03619 family F420-dependent LLM class oxidoreductase [Chloroflexota bacterium]